MHEFTWYVKRIKGQQRVAKMAVWHAREPENSKRTSDGRCCSWPSWCYWGKADCFSSEWQSVPSEYNCILADVPILSWGGCMQGQHWRNGSCANYQRRGIWVADMLATQIVIAITFLPNLLKMCQSVHAECNLTRTNKQCIYRLKLPCLRPNSLIYFKDKNSCTIKTSFKMYFQASILTCKNFI